MWYIVKACVCDSVAKMNVLDLHMNDMGWKGWEAITGALCVESTIAATSQESNHTVASLVYPGNPCLVLPPESVMVRDLLLINENDCICAAREKVWRVWVHPDDKWGEWGRFLEGAELVLVPQILTVFNRSIPPQREGGVERRYRPSLSTLWNVVRALPIESIFGQRLSGEKEVAGPGGEVGGSGEGVGGSREAFASSCVTC